MARIVPRNDPESAVLAYMEREKPLKSVLQGYANRNAKKTMQKVTSLLERMGYDGKNANTVLIRQADPRTIRDLEEIAERLPAKERRQVLAKMYGQIGTGTLTVKRAVNDLLKYGPLQDADKLYADANGVLRKTAQEGMLRGEFMVQKSLGVGWQTETPNIKGVDAFLHRRWDERDATDYLKPMGQVMKDQVTESIFLGESPQKMSQRMQRVEEISKVRADRNARTITTAVANEAQMDSYKKDGVKQYQWVATFDERTCPACGQKDGKKYPMGNGDYPPLHPNCRCTTIAVLSKSIQDRLNANLALHKDDYGAKYIDPNTTFQEWKKGNVVDKPTDSPLKEPTKKEKRQAKSERYTADAEAERVKALPANMYTEQKKVEMQYRRESVESMFKEGALPQETYEKTMAYLDEHPTQDGDKPFLWRDFQNTIGYDNYKAVENKINDRIADWKKEHASDYIRRRAVDYGVTYNTVGMNEKPLSHDEIVQKIGGADRTKGSCVSQAFAYIGNEQGLDVTDFRGGESCETFAGGAWRNLLECGEDKPAMVGIKETKDLLKKMEQGEEYVLITGKHCSVVRMGEAGPEYLELQDMPERCGWKKMVGGEYSSVSDTLKYRFGVRGRSTGGLVNVKEIAKREDVMETIGYINTQPDKALRGNGGGRK